MCVPEVPAVPPAKTMFIHSRAKCCEETGGNQQAKGGIKWESTSGSVGLLSGLSSPCGHGGVNPFLYSPWPRPHTPRHSARSAYRSHLLCLSDQSQSAQKTISSTSCWVASWCVAAGSEPNKRVCFFFLWSLLLLSVALPQSPETSFASVSRPC